VAVTVTFDVPAVVGEPLTKPDDELIDTPAGSPVADQVYGDVPPEALRARLTVSPTTFVWFPGEATVTEPAGGPPTIGCEYEHAPRPLLSSLDQDGSTLNVPVARVRLPMSV
jgi:hypothetical protein